MFNSVEIAGVEPASKQGIHTLSTCLSWFVFSCNDFGPSLRSLPYLLEFRLCIAACKG